jgi:hypothetical protein
VSASDIAAWVAVGLAFISAWVAWLQLRSQLGDIARQTQSLKRQQANDVDLDFDPPFDGSPLPQDRPWYAAVINKSNRPIRDVFCGIPGKPGQRPIPAAHWTILNEWPIVAKNHFSYLLPAYDLGERSKSAEPVKPGAYPKPGDHSRLDIIRSGERIGFTFNHDEWQPGIVVQFTDDADLRWQIDSDSHLQEITAPRHSGPKWLARMFGS